MPYTLLRDTTKKAIEAEIKPLVQEIGRDFGLSSLEDLRVLRTYLRDLLAYTCENLEGHFSIRKLHEAVIGPSPGYFTQSRQFYEYLSKKFTEQGILAGEYRKTGPKGKKIVIEVVDEKL
jgi:hypothetical protein